MIIWNYAANDVISDKNININVKLLRSLDHSYYCVLGIVTQYG